MIGRDGVQSIAHLGTALVVEDDETVRRTVERHLSRARYIVRSTAGEDEALHGAAGADVAVVDLGLAQGIGANLSERLRDSAVTAELPIVMVTARDDLATELRLFAAGADDYVTKPFELLARIDAVPRRACSTTEWTRIAPLAVSADGDASVDGTVRTLTAAERHLLAALARHWPSTTPREVLRSGTRRCSVDPQTMSSRCSSGDCGRSSRRRGRGPRRARRGIGVAGHAKRKGWCLDDNSDARESLPRARAIGTLPERRARRSGMVRRR